MYVYVKNWVADWQFQLVNEDQAGVDCQRKQVHTKKSLILLKIVIFFLLPKVKGYVLIYWWFFLQCDLTKQTAKSLYKMS